MSGPIGGRRLGDEQQDGGGITEWGTIVSDRDIEAGWYSLVLSGKLHILEGRKSSQCDPQLRSKKESAKGELLVFDDHSEKDKTSGYYH